MYEFNICVITVCNRICSQVADCRAGYGACMEVVEACIVYAL